MRSTVDSQHLYESVMFRTGQLVRGDCQLDRSQVKAPPIFELDQTGSVTSMLGTSVLGGTQVN